MHARLLFVFAGLALLLCHRADAQISVGVFQVDATPPIGSPVAYAPARSITDRLSARGVVIVGAGRPIVLCAVDWIGIGNSGYAAWRAKLAAAAETEVTRVAVHTLHQHDGPRCDFAVEEVLARHGLAGRRFDNAFAKQVIDRVANAIENAIQNLHPITHVGIGQAQVEKVASNRRILGDDGKVKIVRYSKSTDPEAIEAPEGVIDPWLRMISFWNHDEAVAAMTYYATHPQSYYGDGDVTSEFVGIARGMREESTKIPHIHFNGAGGNVAAGKYNDGSHERRQVLADRMAAGMKSAWNATEKLSVKELNLSWQSTTVKLPPAEYLNREELFGVLRSADATEKEKLSAAKDLTWLWRTEKDASIDISCLTIGDAHILHMPGELFVEYQLAAQKLKPNSFVCMAAYGDYGPGYIGTQISYSQGGYEVRKSVSRVSPKVESVLHDAMQRLLETRKSNINDRDHEDHVHAVSNIIGKRTYGPSPIPDRIVLTWIGDPATSQAVTWRTDSSVTRGSAQITVATDGPTLTENVTTVVAETSPLSTELGVSHYHSAVFTDLLPETKYAYRVGGSPNWSEWIHFETASDQPKPFSFIYFGDAQNDLKSQWSRVVREAYRDAPQAGFLLHAGDLVNRANRDAEWGEWFYAGGFIHRMVSCIPTPGNHEYFKLTDENDEEIGRELSRNWQPTFTLPDHGPEGLKESAYWIDYQGVRIISLNSNEKIELQAEWLEHVLKANKNEWTILTFHHPIYSSKEGRDNPELRDLWQPILDRYRVDLVLQGHDHTYARTQLMAHQANLTTGVSFHDKDAGTVYVVSVSGPKMYELGKRDFMRSSAENTQLYQIIHIDGNELTYEARTATGRLYDSFRLRKRPGKVNELIEGPNQAETPK